MAMTSFPRSRSPVISIRTQPEEEDTLRAEIEAATRTQHEILPRYSWHSTFTKRDNPYISRPNQMPYRPALHKDLPPSQLTRSFVPDPEDELDNYRPKHVEMNDDAAINASTFSKPKKSWKRLKKRSENAGHTQTTFVKTMPLTEAKDIPQKRQKSIWMSKRNKNVVTDQDREAQQAQFSAWLVEKFEERFEEQDDLPGILDTSPLKPKRAIRRSVYGSLSNTKNFFRKASKHQFEKSYTTVPSNVFVAPHVYDFETKDQLRDYLGDASVISPLSPTENIFRIDESTNDREPAELSAGPLPAELEATLPGDTVQSQAVMSRISTPSVRDLPPYPYDKKYQVDLAKMASFQDQQSQATHQDKHNSPGKNYMCNVCRKWVLDCDVFDFCTSCDRVICTTCGEQTTACQHRAEERHAGVSSDQNTGSHSFHQPTAIKRKKVGDFSFPSQRLDDNISDTDMANLSRACAQISLGDGPEAAQSYNSGNPNQKLRTNLIDLQSDLLKEFGLLRRERELGDRERDLTFRARELEIREREAIVQQKNDILMQRLETLVSYQELAKNAFIGAQFQSQGQTISADLANETTPYSSTASNRVERIVLEHSKSDCKGDVDLRTGVLEAVVDAQTSISANTNSDTHIRSVAAQKRKKDSGNSSPNSVPTTVSSPTQSRKTLSRGNSERDAGQDEDEEDEEGQRSPKKNKAEPPSPNGRQVLFACPYSKHDPIRFSSRNMVEKNYRGCDGHFLTDVSRLKQHLKRVHWQPETYCPRCYEEFSSSSKLTQHATATVACARRECPFPEKMNKTQQDQIHTKRPRVDPETVWYDIYKVLFPGAPLPDSPYVEKEEKLLTPLSATPLSATNDQAAQHLSRIFNERLNQHETLKDPHSRRLINQALTESFAELLNTFSLSPAPSPGAGPSIVVSPVSSSETTRTMLDSPLASASRPSGPERKRSVTTVVSQPQHVPILQQPRPPRLQLDTVLQVPLDHHRSLSSQSKHVSPTSASSSDAVVFNIGILPHIQDDPGYDDECPSFKEGDDQIAMAWVPEQAPPAFRNKSVTSIDSGYGSGRSQNRVDIEALKTIPQIPSIPTADGHYSTRPENSVLSSNQQPHFPSVDDSSISSNTFATYYPEHSTSNHQDHSISAFSSYLYDLDPEFQEFDTQGIDYSLVDASNQWNIP